MYLIDTNVISEARKGARANAGVQRFLDTAARETQPLYLSAITVGELRRGVDRIRHRGDPHQAQLLERWLEHITTEFDQLILSVDAEVAQVWGRLRVPQPENSLDKMIAATALLYQLTVVTRNEADFTATGVTVLNPFD